MRIRPRVVVGLASVGALVAAVVPFLSTGHAQASSSSGNHFNAIQLRLMSSELVNAMGNANSPQVAGNDNGGGPDGAPNTPPSAFATSGVAGKPANYFPAGSGVCSTNNGSNIKVNQNCLNISDSDLQGRGQSNNETSIAQDPVHTQNLVASYNDYVRGDGTCGAAYSTTRGATWNDSTVPNIFTRGSAFGGNARAYWQSAGDTSVAWDTKGNAYLSCQLFNRGSAASANADQSSAFVVFRSTGNSGASWNFPGRFVASAFDPTGTAGEFLDKQLMTVDTHTGSPFQDRIYVSWTDFAPDGTAYIYEAHSNDYGQTFGPRVLVSANGPFCTNNFGVATPNGNCNENQFSQPFTGPDGALYVTYANFNNQPASGSDNRYEMLIAKSTDGGATFSAPVKVSDYYDLPDCDTYQGAGADPGRSCVPEKGSGTTSVFRATNYPVGAVNPVNGQVVVTFPSYINAVSKESNGCVPAGFSVAGNPTYTGVKTVGACNNKILISTSTNGGASFTGTSADPRNEAMVTQGAAQAGTDQWWQWLAINSSGQTVVSYYDRQYGNDETTGFMDFTLSGKSVNIANFGQTRVTTGSMPPPTQFGGPKGGQFLGDYTGLAAVSNLAFPIWADTRSPDLFVCPGTATPGNPPALCTATESNGLQANDADIYTALVGIPAGS